MPGDVKLQRLPANERPGRGLESGEMFPMDTAVGIDDHVFDFLGRFQRDKQVGSPHVVHGGADFLDRNVGHCDHGAKADIGGGNLPELALTVEDMDAPHPTQSVTARPMITNIRIHIPDAPMMYRPSCPMGYYRIPVPRQRFRGAPQGIAERYGKDAQRDLRTPHISAYPFLLMAKSTAPERNDSCKSVDSMKCYPGK